MRDFDAGGPPRPVGGTFRLGARRNAPAVPGCQVRESLDPLVSRCSVLAM
uniref:Uncharacterized protein n=1 Tax=uncultured Nocardioidaceae bacterium TaxID=253824 RepID=A0A6J4LET6_9ACTN|nr:MAG: hypothetical protein AVDCRST_MAG46-1350 [uncultured Nocardioidaceae bacterium]